MARREKTEERLEQDRQAVELYKSGKTVQQVVQELRSSTHKVTSALKDAGVFRQMKRGSYRKFSREEVLELRRQGQTQKAIADRYGVTRQAISLALQKIAAGSATQQDPSKAS